ncbi:YT521-B-like domain [Sarracenia purpurea var. burkii]
MLQIFKNYPWKRSLLDDFMYYENRQKIMQKEKTRVTDQKLWKFIPYTCIGSPRKQNFLFDISSTEEEKTTKSSELHCSEKIWDSVTGQVTSCSDVSSLSMAKEIANCMMDEAKDDEDKDDISSSVQVGSLTINPKQAESKPSEASSIIVTVASTKTVDVVPVG